MRLSSTGSSDDKLEYIEHEDFPMELILNYKRVYGSRAPRSNTVLKVHGEMS